MFLVWDIDEDMRHGHETWISTELTPLLAWRCWCYSPLHASTKKVEIWTSGKKQGSNATLLVLFDICDWCTAIRAYNASQHAWRISFFMGKTRARDQSEDLESGDFTALRRTVTTLALRYGRQNTSHGDAWSPNQVVVQKTVLPTFLQDFLSHIKMTQFTLDNNPNQYTINIKTCLLISYEA